MCNVERDLQLIDNRAKIRFLNCQSCEDLIEKEKKKLFNMKTHEVNMQIALLQ